MLICAGLDRLHIGVGEAEMMADLVDQHVADDSPERLVMFGPVIQDLPAVEPDYVGQPRYVSFAAKRQAHALEQAEQVEFAFRPHLVENFLGRKIVNANDHALAKVAEGLWQAREDLVRHGFPLGARWGFG